MTGDTDARALGAGIGGWLRGDESVGGPPGGAPTMLVIALESQGKIIADDFADHGWRVMALIAPDDAAAHLGRLVRADCVWLDASSLDADWMAGPLGQALTARLDRDEAVAIEAPAAQIDAVMDWSDGQAACRLLCQADRLDRLASAAGLARGIAGATFHDVSVAGAPDRLDQLQEEVARIARMLSQLTAREAGSLMSPPATMDYAPPPGDRAGAARPADGLIGLPATAASAGAPPADGDDGQDFPRYRQHQLRAGSRTFRDHAAVSDTVGAPAMAGPLGGPLVGQGPSPIIDPGRDAASVVRDMIRLRRLREQYFSPDLFADPAWDMLLDLYVARLERQPVSVSSLCIAAAVPATTALRWIKTMTEAGLFRREADPRDGRRIFIALSDQSAEAMDRFFAAARTGR